MKILIVEDEPKTGDYPVSYTHLDVYKRQPHMLTLKPGDTSRTTGSATRWNSFTPWFMRQGSVQPLSVTTGL